MSWFGWGGSSKDEKSPSSTLGPTAAPMDMSGGASGAGFDSSYGYPSFEQPAPHDSSHLDSSPTSYLNQPVLALDAIKQAGVPVTRQMTPYLQMDPTLFAASTPQYIMPDGGTSGKGKFEFALGHIGWAVGTGFFLGCARGAIGEFVNPETRKMTGKPWTTRMVNATVKHGSGYAQPAGAVVFMYSALEIALRQLRADDELNGLGAGAITGAIYRSPHGIRAAGIGSGAGLGLAFLWMLVNEDSRRRFMEMFNLA